MLKILAFGKAKQNQLVTEDVKYLAQNAPDNICT